MVHLALTEIATRDLWRYRCDSCGCVANDHGCLSSHCLKDGCKCDGWRCTVRGVTLAEIINAQASRDEQGRFTGARQLSMEMEMPL